MATKKPMSMNKQANEMNDRLKNENITSVDIVYWNNRKRNRKLFLVHPSNTWLSHNSFCHDTIDSRSYATMNGVIDAIFTGNLPHILQSNGISDEVCTKRWIDTVKTETKKAHKPSL